jgi:CubicO group peptidase (beta-lactamase class C family)
MYKIRLAKQPGPPVQARARGYYSGPCTVFEVIGSSESQGRKVTFVAAGKQIAQGVLQHRDGRPALWILQPISTSEEKLKAEVLLDGSPVTMIVLPPAAQGRARAMVDEPVARQLFCFGTKEFPSLDFERPLEVQCLLCGPYTVQTTYYDAGFNKVTTAEKPGRYGAIMEVKTEDGRTLRRFRTLYRTPGRAKWWDSEMKVSIELDENLGIKPKTAQRFSDDLSGYVRSRFYSGLYDDPDMAVLLAGLSEAREEGGQPTPAENPWSVDQQWWVTMKRKLYGTDKEFPNPFVCPRPLEGQPARVVHEGTLEEAGMSDEGVAGIDAVCKKWAADSDEAFAVCIVRHGVIAFHKAYGRRNGKDMTVDTPSRMASITKLISGTTMMLAIDQGLVGLDETVDKYLPPFRGIQVANPLTVRHLYTHTSGLWGHWGAELNDFEELLAEYYPSLDVGKRFDYNGAGFDLGGKILEAVSGESMENFYGNHLLEPLGCGMNTTVKDGGGGAMSIPLDMARIGQMLLNRGAYGDKRFFSEASFEQMLPKPLNAVFKIEPTTREYGIGVSWETDKNILPKDTFGHGAASSATFRVIPSQDMVIVMCRNSAGANFDVYHPEFLKSVLEAVQDRATTQQN